MAFGIKKGYPNLRKYFGKLSDYISLCRPFTLLGAFLAGVSLDILFSRLSSNPLNLLHPILVGLTLAMLQGGGQSLNISTAEEVKIDILNKKSYRPTVNGRISLKEGKIISSVLFSLGILLAFSLNMNYGFFSLLITFFAVAYTVEPIRMKKRFLLNNIWQGIARGLLPAVYVASAYEGYGVLPILFGLVLMLWVSGFQASKDFDDIRGDRAYGVKTFPVVLGKEGALKLMGVFGTISFLALNLFILLGLFQVSFFALNILVLPSILLVLSLKKGIKSGYFENNVGWGFFYGTLALFYILPVVLI